MDEPCGNVYGKGKTMKYSASLQKEIEKIIESRKMTCSIEDFEDSVKLTETNVDLICLIREESLSEEFIEHFSDNRMFLDLMVQFQKLSEEFIIRHKDIISWRAVSCCQMLSEKFIEEFSDKLDWNNISENQVLSEEFIEKHLHRVNWTLISRDQKLSEEFIEKFKNRVNWAYISSRQVLSEAFIEKNQDLVIWLDIFMMQKLSEEFIKKFQNRVQNWAYIFKYHKLSNSFIKKFSYKCPYGEYIDRYHIIPKDKSEDEKYPRKIDDNKNNWLDTPNCIKEKYIRKHSSYEIMEDEGGDFIMAYKGVRFSGYSKYSFRYKYEIGKEYEAHCDCNLDEGDSFGLSAWTLNGARQYCNQKIILVKLYIKYIGAIVYDGNKIRCFKFKVVKEIS